MSARAGIMIALLCLCGSALAEVANRNEVMQKALLVRRLLGAAEPARPADAAASVLHARALEHLGRGEYLEADARLNEAIRAMQLERRQAAPSRTAQPHAPLGARYESLLSSVELMRATYARYHAAREDPHGTLLVEVDERVLQARRLRAEEQPGDAVHALELAEQSLTHAFTQLIGSVTVSYAVRFSGPREEYEHELARHRAYAVLVPAALNELRPAGGARLLVDRHVESAQALAALGAREAAQGEWQAALGRLTNATQHLQRALGAAGLAVPQEAGP